MDVAQAVQAVMQQAVQAAVAEHRGAIEDAVKTSMAACLGRLDEIIASEISARVTPLISAAAADVEVPSPSPPAVPLPVCSRAHILAAEVACGMPFHTVMPRHGFAQKERRRLLIGAVNRPNNGEALFRKLTRNSEYQFERWMYWHDLLVAEAEAEMATSRTGHRSPNLSVNPDNFDKAVDAARLARGHVLRAYECQTLGEELSAKVQEKALITNMMITTPPPESILARFNERQTELDAEIAAAEKAVGDKTLELDKMEMQAITLLRTRDERELRKRKRTESPISEPDTNKKLKAAAALKPIVQAAPSQPQVSTAAPPLLAPDDVSKLSLEAEAGNVAAKWRLAQHNAYKRHAELQAAKS
jgi:hypothetical protein